MTFDEFLHRACPPLHLDWRKYRRSAARHRVQRRMAELGLADYSSYLRRLKTDPAEAAGLADLMRVTVTRFFRERDRWGLLARIVLPELLRTRSPSLTFRAWSAGCAGGEEPYSLAALWVTEIAPSFPDRSLHILATDIDEASLARAQRAVYQASSLRELPRPVRDALFHRCDDRWQPDEVLRRMVNFRRHNLAADPPPGRFDLVCCRYLPFTYYRGERRLRVARRLHRGLAPDGVLMIGSKEELGSAEPLFSPWPDAPGFFLPVQPPDT